MGETDPSVRLLRLLDRMNCEGAKVARREDRDARTSSLLLLEDMLA